MTWPGRQSVLFLFVQPSARPSHPSCDPWTHALPFPIHWREPELVINGKLLLLSQVVFFYIIFPFFIFFFAALFLAVAFQLAFQFTFDSEKVFGACLFYFLMRETCRDIEIVCPWYLTISHVKWFGQVLWKEQLFCPHFLVESSRKSCKRGARGREICQVAISVAAKCLCNSWTHIPLIATRGRMISTYPKKVIYMEIHWQLYVEIRVYFIRKIEKF